MIVFSNRQVDTALPEVFSRRFTPASPQLTLASVTKKGAGWNISSVDKDVDDADSLNALLPLFKGKKPVLVYIHGNNNTPEKCFERCALLESLYGVPVVGFSWPSEGYLPDGNPLPGMAADDDDDGDEQSLKGVKLSNRSDSGIRSKIARYHQAKTNAQDSTDALARFLRMVGTARLYANQQPFSLAIHSLGAHLFQYALGIPGANEAASTAHNIALLAACSTASGHKNWLAKFKPKGQLFVAFNKADSVLLAASIADDQHPKLGADPGPDVLRAGHVRYISFSNANSGLGGHRYFARDNMPKKHLKVFTRIFASEMDIQGDEYPRKVYPVGCDSDGLTCYMGAPDHTEP